MTERSGLLGAVADEIDQIEAQLRGLDDEAARQVGQLAGVDAGLREHLTLTVRRQMAQADTELRLKRQNAIQKRGDLRQEQRDLRKQAQGLEPWLAERKERAERGTRALALILEVRALLDQAADGDALDYLARVPITFPRRYAEQQSRLRGIERRLEELGDE